MAPAAKNRYLATIRRILNLVMEWEWIDRVPKLKAFEEPDVRVRWEPPAVITQLIQAISQDWLKEVALFAVSTGTRADEILSLAWSQVDIVRRTAWVTHSGAKSKRARAVPLNDDAVAVLRRRLGQHDTLVFTRQAAKGRDVAKISQIDAHVRPSMQGGQDRGFPLSRSAAHLGELAHSARHAAHGAGRLGADRDGAEVRAPGHFAPRRARGNVKFWSNDITQKETPPARAALSA